MAASVLYERERSATETFVDKQHSNYLRGICLVFIVAPRAVKRFFLTKHPDKSVLTQQLKEKKSELEREYGFPKHKRSAIFPDLGVVNPEEFDLSLLIFLLKNFTKIPAPSAGWNTEPSFFDNSEAADLLRIRRIRNDLAHNQDGKLDDNKFERMWKEMEVALGRIGHGNFTQEIERIKTLSEDDIREQTHHLEEIMDEIREPVPFNIRHQIKDEVEEWVTEDKKFYDTKFAKNVYQAAIENDFLMILGNSGSGKTVTMHHVALKLWTEGYDVVPVHKPTDIRTYYYAGKKQLFLVDDCVGVHYLDDSRVKEWEDLKSDLIRWKLYTGKNTELRSTVSRNPEEKEKCNCKILVSSRLFLTKLERFPAILLKIECINIQDEHNSLDYSERKEIFKKVLRNTRTNSNISEDCPISETTAMRFDSFPLLCRMCAQLNFDPAMFFNFPFRYFLDEIESIYLHNKRFYFVLIFCLILKCKFPKRTETDNLQVFEAILDKCHLESGISHELIRDSIKAMKGTYLCKTGEDELDFHHVTIRDIIAFHFTSKSGFPILARYASDSFIRDRVRPNGRLDIDNPDDEFFITLNAEDRSRYIERACRDLLEKDWLITLRCPFFPDSHLENCIYSHLEEIGKLHVLLTDKNKFQNPKKLNIFNYYNFLSAWIDDFPFKETFHDIDHLREELLRPLPFIFWSIGFGWFKMFSFLYERTTSKIRRVIQKSRHAALVLSVLGGNEMMTMHIDNDIAKTNGMCFFCDSSSILTRMFVHHCDCPIKNLSSFTVACIMGNSNLTRYLGERLSFTPNTEFDISVLESVRLIPRLLDSGPLQPIQYTAIDIACRLGHSRIVEHFLEETNTIVSLEKRARNLSMACIKGHYGVANILLRNISEEEIMQQDIKRLTETLLIYSSLEGFDTIVTLLLCRNVQVDACDEKKRTSLLAACDRGHKNVVEILLSKNANVNRYDIFGWTPLKIACAKGYVEIVQLLLADENISFDDPKLDESSEEEINLANRGMVEMVEEIRERKFAFRGSLNIALGYGKFPLFLSCYNGYHEIAEILIKKGATLNRRCKVCGNATPLIAAFFRYYPKVLCVLLTHMDIDAHQSEPFDQWEIDGPMIPMSFFAETEKLSFVKQDRLETIKMLITTNVGFLL